MHRPPTVLSHSVVAELQTSPMVGLDVLIANFCLTGNAWRGDGSVVSVKHNFVCGGRWAGMSAGPEFLSARVAFVR